MEKGLNTVVLGAKKISIEDVVAISKVGNEVKLSADKSFTTKVDEGVRFLDQLLKEEGHIYGVTTGYGDSCTVDVPHSLLEELPIHLTRFHGCGLGDFFNQEQGRAILAARLVSLSQGYSGVSWNLLNLLVAMLNNNIVPVIPEEGSVGASGDLTPLSYIAGALIGERDVYYNNTVMNSLEAFKLAGLAPITLRPKEGLAIMNGTAVMTALACTAYDRAEYLAKLMSRITALASLALKGNSNHFDDILFSVKPHPGQNQIALV